VESLRVCFAEFHRVNEDSFKTSCHFMAKFMVKRNKLKRGFGEIFSVMPAQAGIQGFRPTASWIAQKLHYVSCLRRNDACFLLKLPGP